MAISKNVVSDGLAGELPPVAAESHQLDVSAEQARALHRVVRAMHDGHCPKCSHLDSADMFQHCTSNLHRCPKCAFTVTAMESQKALEAFSPHLLKSVEVFEEWRKHLLTAPVDEKVLAQRELSVIAKSHRKLKSMGWSEPHPYDRDHEMLVLEAGSTGIHKGYCDTAGSYWIEDGTGDTDFVTPLLVKRGDKL